MSKTYMLDTNICSFIILEQLLAVIRRLDQTVLRNLILLLANNISYFKLLNSM